MVYKVLIVGAGQLGSRHLQSIKKVNLRTQLFVYDISIEALKIAAERYKQIAGEGQVEKVEFVNSLSKVDKEIDFAIISTSSKKRAEIITSVVEFCHIKYMLIEKVLFQSLSEYDQIQALLYKKNIKAWVNCPRRMNAFYKELAQKFINKKISVTIEGTQWGMGCNTIHFIDFVSFLTGDNNYCLTEHLDHEILESKRVGYIEFTGSIDLTWSNGTKCRIISHQEGDCLLPVITLVSETERMLIDESKGEIFIGRKADHWEWKNEKFRIKFQSELTSEVFENLIRNEQCDLTPYEESVKLHKPFIETILGFLNRNYQEGIKNCPIT